MSSNLSTPAKERPSSNPSMQTVTSHNLPKNSQYDPVSENIELKKKVKSIN